MHQDYISVHLTNHHCVQMERSLVLWVSESRVTLNRQSCSTFSNNSILYELITAKITDKHVREMCRSSQLWYNWLKTVEFCAYHNKTNGTEKYSFLWLSRFKSNHSTHMDKESITMTLKLFFEIYQMRIWVSIWYELTSMTLFKFNNRYSIAVK